MGSTRDARRAGRYPARAATANRAAVANARTAGSAPRTEQDAVRVARCRCRQRDAHRGAGRHQAQRLARHQPHDVAAAGAQSHANADFRRAAGDGVGHETVETERGQQQRERPEAAGQRRQQPLAEQRILGLRAQGLGAEDRQIAVHGGDGAAYLIEQGGAGAVPQLERNVAHPQPLRRVHARPGLKQRPVQNRARLRAGAAVEGVLHYPDDFGVLQAMAESGLGRAAPGAPAIR